MGSSPCYVPIHLIIHSIYWATGKDGGEVLAVIERLTEGTGECAPSGSSAQP